MAEPLAAVLAWITPQFKLREVPTLTIAKHCLCPSSQPKQRVVEPSSSEPL